MMHGINKSDIKYVTWNEDHPTDMMVSSILTAAPSTMPAILNTNMHSCSNPTSSKTRESITLPSKNQTISLLQRCRSIKELQQVHARFLKIGQDKEPRVLFNILQLCCALKCPGYATEIFVRIESPDVYHYTALIAGLMAVGSYLKVIQLYSCMVCKSIEPDSILIAYVLKACAYRLALREGRQLHGRALKLQSGLERSVRMKLMEVYSKCGEFLDAERVFGELPETDAVAATILISCFCDHGLIKEAQALFCKVHDKDTVCWTAMIDGLVRNGKTNAALELFRKMQGENVQPNEVTIVCVLSACSKLGALELGRWVHSYANKFNIRLNAFVCSTLIDMYSNCGSLEEARELFKEMTERDVVSYNSMISALAMHGRSDEAVKIYQQMVEQGIRPTHITFVGVLTACSHGGLVDMGFEIFESMAKDYGLEPTIEHYGCIVDLLGRVGHLEEAFDFIKDMRTEPDHVIWGTLLSACVIHKNLALGEKVAGILIGSETADSGTYVLLSNVYASSGKWEEAVRIRAKMKEKGIQKEPGCSSVEVNNEIHEFLLGDIRHPQRKEIYRKLEDMNILLRSEGYSPVKDVVLQNIEEGEKEWALAIHSERLAICYGLISTEPGTTVRVMKNLRVCSDCHSTIKLITKVTKRKIVLRDRNRFHHFEDGSCSCGDYW